MFSDDERVAEDCRIRGNIQHGRVHTMEKTCRDMNLTSPITETERRFSMHGLFVDDDRQLIMCVIFKAASTSWKAYLAYTSHIYKAQHPDLDYEIRSANRRDTLELYGIKRLKDYSIEDIEYRITNYYKITLVRHPLTRLISAYRDKVEWRNAYELTQSTNPLKRMTEFALPNITSPDELAQHKMSFGEFVQNILYRQGKGLSLDLHWKTYQDTCLPCKIKYNYIGKFETLNEDFKCLAYKMTHDAVSFPGIGQHGHTSAHHDQAKTTDDLQKTYIYSNLTRHHLQGLGKLYDTDCKVFSYSCLDL